MKSQAQKFFLIMMVTLIVATTGWSQANRILQLDDGMPIVVTPTVDVSSTDNKTGEEITFTLVQACKVDGVVLISEGAKVKGKVEKAVHSKMLGKQGELEVSFESTLAVDGSILPVRATIKNQGNLNDPSAAKKAASMLPYGIGKLGNGKDAILKAGVPLTIFIEGTSKFRIVAGKKPTRVP